VIELVVLDLDGTVLDPHSPAPISAEVVAAIQHVQSRGVGVTLATGRTLEYVRVRAQALDLRLPVITSQGAVLAHPVTGEVLHEALLSEAAGQRLASYVREGPAVVATYLKGPDSQLVIAQNREERSREVYDHWFGDGRIVESDLEPWLARGFRVIKFIVVNAPEEPERAPELRKYFGPDVQVVRTHPFLVEGTASGVDKGSGLRKLLDLLQISRDRVLAVGDHDNDLPMFAEAGLAVAMGQAEENVRQAAHWVAPSVDQDGVAAALRHFIR